MCGIVGAIADRDVVPMLVEGLKRLEYRGYDSAGIAVLDGAVRRVGRVAEMESAAQSEGLAGRLGIGHTRWATHGGVTEPNAHPHVSQGEVAVVHNGIVENHEEQRERLKKLGYVFESQTDTEVVAHLIHYYFREMRPSRRRKQPSATSSARTRSRSCRPHRPRASPAPASAARSSSGWAKARTSSPPTCPRSSARRAA
jgi:glucosamine 6-phosphate synthetase-like amidotransferase/phosphosugar isomerase protein